MGGNNKRSAALAEKIYTLRTAEYFTECIARAVIPGALAIVSRTGKGYTQVKGLLMLASG